MILENYLNLKTRNARVKELRAQGYTVIVRASRNQLIHPQYIVDWKGAEKYDTGLGNPYYKTLVPKMYCLEAW